MIITNIKLQQKDKNRVNIEVDGRYRFSLDVFQVGELGLKIGKEYSEEELLELETESQFGKLYARALEYCLMRPHSAKEVRDYLYRKTLTQKVRNQKTGELSEKIGIAKEVTVRVFDRLIEKGYINDEKFAHYWVENRQQTKGISFRKIKAELQAKGVESGLVERLLHETNRNEVDELRKVVAKKQSRYADDQKFIQYLARQGFTYDLIQRVLAER